MKKQINLIILSVLVPMTLWAHGTGHSTQPKPQEMAQAESKTTEIPKFELDFNYGGKLKAFFTFPTLPYVLQDVVMFVQFKDAKTLEPVVLDKPPFISLYMPQIDMKHGSLPVTVEPRLDKDGKVLPGEYRASNMYFIMGGAWDVQINLGGFIFGDSQKFIMEFDPESGGCISHSSIN